MKSLNEMRELKRLQGFTVDTISRRRLIEDRDTILKLTARVQELQNEINCMNDSRDFQDAESVRSGQSHVPSQPAFFPSIPPGSRPSRNNGPPSIWDVHGIYFETFLQIQRRRLQHLIRKCQIHGSQMYQNTHHRM